MEKFTKIETKVLTSIFLVLFVVSGYNLLVSLRRGRDSIRKNDMSAIQKSLDTYHQKYSMYPKSTENDEIIGCFDTGPVLDVTGGVINAKVCEWGESKFEDTNPLPRDPSYKKGVSYKYVSDVESYMLYIPLEGKDEAEYTKAIADKNLQCGTKICNYGRGN